jgi:hypothetical protein
LPPSQPGTTARVCAPPNSSPSRSSTPRHRPDRSSAIQ